MAFRKGGGSKSSTKKEKHDQEEDVISVAGRPICSRNSSGTLKCNPMSYSFIDRWDELDTDKDGKWSLDEARADEANLGCRLGIAAEDVFRSNCRGVLRDVEDTASHRPNNIHLVPTSIIEYDAVPKAYFDWWAGLVVLCVNFDANRCSNLVANGIFDAAIDSGGGVNAKWMKGGIKDLDSAIDYCQRILAPGGLCEQALPGFYLTYRSRVQDKCGTVAFTGGNVYANPFNDRDVMATTHVSYSNVDIYTESSTWRFRLFLFMVLMVWYMNLLEEFQDILKLADFIMCFPVDSTNPFLMPDMQDGDGNLLEPSSPNRSNSRPELDTGVGGAARPVTPVKYMQRAHAQERKLGPKDDQSESSEEDDRFVVEVIARPHWFMCVFICVLRSALLIYFLHIGTTLLLADQGYTHLLLSVIALSFVLDLPSMLYLMLTSDKAKKALEEAHTIEYETGLPTRGFAYFCLSKPVWGLVLLPVLVYWMVSFNYAVNTMPVLEALRCTCLQEGPQCEAAHRFTHDWWDSYWKHIHFMFATNKGSYLPDV